MAPQLGLWDLVVLLLRSKVFNLVGCNGSDTENAFACIGRESCLHA